MPSSGPNYFSVVSSAVGSNSIWNNPTNAENAPDGIYSTVGGTSNILDFSSWASSSIPGDATILTIIVGIYGHRGSSSSGTYKLYGYNGSNTNKNSAQTLSGNISIFGTSDSWAFSTDITNLFTSDGNISFPTVANINNGLIGFGFQIITYPSTFSVDSGRMTITYSEPVNPSLFHRKRRYKMQRGNEDIIVGSISRMKGRLAA